MGSAQLDGVRRYCRPRARRRDGGAMLLADASAMFVPVLGMIAGIAAVTAANHERLKQRIGELEQRLAQAEWGCAKRRQQS